MSTAATYTLNISGAPATQDVLGAIQEIEMEDHSEMADMLRIRLACAVKPGGNGWTIADDAIFERLTLLKLSVTVGSNPAVPLFNGYVIENDIEFSDQPTGSIFSVVAMDSTILMHLEERVKSWPNMADSDVASAIFSSADYGFTPVVTATGLTPNENDHTLTQRGTDMQFLKQLAEANGYECYLDLNESSGDVEGHFHPPETDGDPQATLSINMGTATNVNRFRVRYDRLGPTTASGTVVDYEQKSDEPGQADTASETGLGSDESTSTDRPRKVLLSGIGMGQSAEVQRYAQSVVDRSAWAITAEGELNTVAFGSVLRAKEPVMVRGAGKEFSGRYYVHKVVHIITSDGSYLQRFKLIRNAVGLTGQEKFSSDNTGG